MIRHMVRDRALGAILATIVSLRMPRTCRRMWSVIVGQHCRAAQPDERLVEGDVGRGIGGETSSLRPGALELGEELRRLLMLGLAAPSDSRAAMLSSAAQAWIISTISRLVFLTTRMPRRGTVRRNPSCSSIATASRIGVRLTPSLSDNSRSSSMIGLGGAVKIHVEDGFFQRGISLGLEASSAGCAKTARGRNLLGPLC